MGITIHYSGTFRNDCSLPEMIDEAIAFATSEGWDFFILDRDFSEKQELSNENEIPPFGILVNPPDCEPVWLCFNPNRKLGTYSDLRTCIMETWVPDDGPDGGHWEPDPLPDDYEPSWMAHTKTQYAGARIHLKVVQLLKLIAEKYLLEFECHDETGFWDHCDEHKLMQRFGEFAL